MKLTIITLLLTVSYIANSQEIDGFTLKDARSNKTYSINSKNKAAIALIFHSNKCAYSKYYIDRIKSLVNEFGPKQVEFVLINSNSSDLVIQESPDKMKQYLIANDLNIPYLIDNEKSLKSSLRATRTPEVFLFNAKLKLVYSGSIDDSPQSEGDISHAYLKEAILTLLDNNQPEVNKTRAVGCLIK